MDKDTLRAIKIINEILGDIARYNTKYAGAVINEKRQELTKIINDNKDNESKD